MNLRHGRIIYCYKIYVENLCLCNHLYWITEHFIANKVHIDFKAVGKYGFIYNNIQSKHLKFDTKTVFNWSVTILKFWV